MDCLIVIQHLQRNCTFRMMECLIVIQHLQRNCTFRMMECLIVIQHLQRNCTFKVSSNTTSTYFKYNLLKGTHTAKAALSLVNKQGTCNTFRIQNTTFHIWTPLLHSCKACTPLFRYLYYFHGTSRNSPLSPFGRPVAKELKASKSHGKSH